MQKEKKISKKPENEEFFGNLKHNFVYVGLLGSKEAHMRSYRLPLKHPQEHACLSTGTK